MFDNSASHDSFFDTLNAFEVNDVIQCSWSVFIMFLPLLQLLAMVSISISLKTSREAAQSQIPWFAGDISASSNGERVSCEPELYAFVFTVSV